jgi:hypothetical protein
MLTGLHHRDSEIYELRFTIYESKTVSWPVVNRKSEIANRNGEGRRICASDLMHVKHPLWRAELCPRKWWG